MCIKNPKRFLFWEYYGDCKNKVVRFGRFMECSSQFVATFECVLCGRQTKQHFVSEDTLLEMGVPIETIIENRKKLY
jgi:hypothetical protein